MTSVDLSPLGAFLATYRCEVCGAVNELVALAERQLAGPRRQLTPDERERYLG